MSETGGMDLTRIGATVAAELARLRGSVAAAETLVAAVAEVPFPRAAQLVLDAPAEVRAELWEVSRP